MLMDVFAGILAALMLFVAGLLGLLILVNTLRGEGAANTNLLIVAFCFAIGGLGFYFLKRWAKRAAHVQREPQRD